jgi:hypothetical protein
MSFLLSRVFFFNKIGEEKGGIGSSRKGVGEDVAQTMYTHVNKYKND